LWEDVIDQERGAFGHAPGPATGAEAAALATEGDELFIVAELAFDAQKTVLQSSAAEVGFELALDVVG
jgi:hypothetical protein